MTSSNIGHTAIIDDFEMYFEVRGEGSPLLLLHGGGGIGANWNLIFPSSPSSFQLIVPDMRGHGRSTNPSGKFTFKQFAFDVFALLDLLGIDDCKAIGMSLGAKTLLHMATQQPNRIEAMVLVSGTPYFPAQARAAMATLAPEYRSEDEWNQMRESHLQGDEQIKTLWTSISGLKDSYDDMNFTQPYLSTISARTLIVHGDRDPLYPVNLAIEMYQSIPEASLWVVPNSGHGPIFAEYTGEGTTTTHFAEAALAFLRGGAHVRPDTA